MEKLSKANEKNLFAYNKEETAEMYKSVTHSIIDLFRCFHYVDPHVESTCLTPILDLTTRAVELINFLMSIKGFGSFDCQSFFLKTDGIRALFGIKSYTEKLFPGVAPADFDAKRARDLEVQTKILMQMLTQSENN